MGNRFEKIWGENKKVWGTPIIPDRWFLVEAPYYTYWESSILESLTTIHSSNDSKVIYITKETNLNQAINSREEVLPEIDLENTSSGTSSTCYVANENNYTADQSLRPKRDTKKPAWMADYVSLH